MAKKPAKRATLKHPIAAGAVALAPQPSQDATREYLVELAWRNGALQITADRLQRQAERNGEPVPDDATALDQAKDLVAAFGMTSPDNLPHDYLASPADWRGPGGLIAGYAKLAAGRNPRGRRITGSGGTGTSGPVGSVSIRPGFVKDAQARVARLQAERKAKAARVELAAEGVANSDQQREAHVLVRIELLSLAEAGRRLYPPCSKQNVAKLLAKYDKAAKSTNLTKSATSPGGG